jgi:hypothetical protein
MQLKQQLTVTKRKHKEELQTKRTYEDLLSQAKEEKRTLKTQAEFLQRSLQSTRNVLQSERQESKKTQETKNQSRQLLTDLRESVELEERKKKERVEMLRKVINGASTEEEQRLQQAQLVEPLQEAGLRQSLLMHRFWHKCLVRKLDHELHESEDIQEVFEPLKVATGLQDLEAIVERSIEQKQICEHLKQSVEEAERQVEALKIEQAEARELFLLEANGNPQEICEEIELLEGQVQRKTEEYNFANRQLQETVAVHDQILDWARHLTQRLQTDTLSSESLEDNSLSDLFSKITTQVQLLLKPIAASTPDDWEERSTNEIAARNSIRPTETVSLGESSEDGVSKKELE